MYFAIGIRKEIAEIEKKLISRENNLLKNAPHTQIQISSDEWNRPYSRERAAFPLVSDTTENTVTFYEFLFFICGL